MARLLIAASGTGGHLFPALAVADRMPSEWQVSWLGVPDRLERELVPTHYPLHTVRACGLQGRGFKKLLQLWQLLASTIPVAQLLRRQQCEVVFTTGGYIAAPAILAAKWCGIPVVLHESNATPGRVTRLLGRYCQKVALGFPQAQQFLPACHPLVTGTPVRQGFLAPAPCPEWVPQGKGPLLLVIGGSQGALGLNRMVRPLLPALLAQGCRVVQLSGSHDPDFGSLQHPGYVERQFSNEIPGLLQHCNLAISRAGAGSISELAACNTPALLVPFPQAADNHQVANAEACMAVGAAVLMLQHQPEGQPLSRMLWRLLGPRLRGAEGSADPLTQLAAGMARLAVRDADQQLVNLLCELSMATRTRRR
ncbi:MAG: UDP-N-acetylglucosamine--N-acetylmuramyl-(pentapeptide) pyrophosphoryl-undecaprenol N-acetylglucosamine transferase [Cyanobacteria bacterium]|nr:UDP-N-acetylglucosamine--N-acetylmuramyl-(pentapeptide) pyrophosphoryl-undecaprenol N-acetylglucosamine transferase [Cyanobacteriota bacterium]MDA1169596.1 UDP-N-acetylglucosamine--N-acetylmuramyl-(pentapeptide) pyrophosphoryl-undecaprenol N-acetylglucosamine transferase [Cyanobacteriota bacterium]